MKRGLLRRREQGANAVEFAILAPVLIILLFGIIGFGWTFSQQLALNNAVREGARFAVAVGNDTARQCNQVQGVVQNRLAGTTLAAEAGSVTVKAAVADALQLATNSNYPSLPLASNPAPCSGTVVLCANSFDPANGYDSVVVEAAVPVEILLTGIDVTLRATSVYKCEFSTP